MPYSNLLLIALILCLIYCLPFFSFLTQKKWWKKVKKKKWWQLVGLRKVAKLCGWLAAILSLLIIVNLFIDSSYEFVWWDIDPEIWAYFGSFIGALLLAATLLYQVRSFRKQQVEAKFFEMIKYYRDNISEMHFRNPFFYTKNNKNKGEEYVVGRRVIKTIFEQYKVALKQVAHELQNKIFIFSSKNISASERTLKEMKLQSNIAYLITFWGTPHDITHELEKALCKECEYLSAITPKDLVSLIKSTQKVISVYECSTPENYLKSLINVKKPIIKCRKNSGKSKFFNGHQYHLAHYFRHFYRSVRYIDRQPSWLLSLAEKKEFIELLRAQMSNYEQALLFVNSISSLGNNWEYKDDVDLISKYHLIRNLPEHFIPLPQKNSFINPGWYYPKVDFEWKDKSKS